MAYLTYKEYLEMGFEPLELDEFNRFPRFLMRASSVVDHITRNFYKRNDLETDYDWRRDAFKKAVACQIEYFNELGGFTLESINAEPQAQQIGRVNIAHVSRFNPSGANELRQLTCPDIYIHLEGTGLLSRRIR